jgi:hypothetical protein
MEMSLGGTPPLRIHIRHKQTSGHTSIPCTKEVRAELVKFRRKYEEVHGEQRSWNPILLALVQSKPFLLLGQQ